MGKIHKLGQPAKDINSWVDLNMCLQLTMICVG